MLDLHHLLDGMQVRVLKSERAEKVGTRMTRVASPTRIFTDFFS